MFVSKIIIDSVSVHGVLYDAMTVDRVLAAHLDLKDVCAIVDDAEAVLVVGGGEPPAFIAIGAVIAEQLNA